MTTLEIEGKSQSLAKHNRHSSQLSVAERKKILCAEQQQDNVSGVSSFFGFTNPADGRKRQFPPQCSKLNVRSIQIMFNIYFTIFPETPTSQRKWQILEGLIAPPPLLFSGEGVSQPQAPQGCCQ